MEKTIFSQIAANTALNNLSNPEGFPRFLLCVIRCLVKIRQSLYCPISPNLNSVWLEELYLPGIHLL